MRVVFYNTRKVCEQWHHSSARHKLKLGSWQCPYIYFFSVFVVVGGGEASSPTQKTFLRLRLSFTFSSVSSLARSPRPLIVPNVGTATEDGWILWTDGRCGLAFSTCGSVSRSLCRPLQCRFVPCLRPPNERARPENGGDLITRGPLTNGEVDSRLTLTARS